MQCVVRSVVGVVSQLDELAIALNAFGLPSDWRYDLLPDEFLFGRIHNPDERAKLVAQSKASLALGEFSEDVSTRYLMSHSLWKLCIQLSIRNPSLEPIICGNPWWHGTVLYSSATLIVSTAGRAVVQKRREGYQDFGGGKHATSFFQKMHSVQRELKMESGVSYDNSAISYISPPMFVCQNQSGWNTAVLVRIAVVNDDLISSTTSGRVKIGEESLYSRECARADYHDAGWMFDNKPIFHILDVRNARHPACAVHWRQCDWLTRVLLSDVIDRCITHVATHSQSEYLQSSTA